MRRLREFWEEWHVVILAFAALALIITGLLKLVSIDNKNGQAERKFITKCMTDGYFPVIMDRRGPIVCMNADHDIVRIR